MGGFQDVGGVGHKEAASKGCLSDKTVLSLVCGGGYTTDAFVPLKKTNFTIVILLHKTHPWNKTIKKGIRKKRIKETITCTYICPWTNWQHNTHTHTEILNERLRHHFHWGSQNCQLEYIFTVGFSGLSGEQMQQGKSAAADTTLCLHEPARCHLAVAHRRQALGLPCSLAFTLGFRLPTTSIL